MTTTSSAALRHAMHLAREQRIEEALDLLNEALRTATELGQAGDIVRLCCAAAVLCGNNDKLPDAARYYEEAARVFPDDPYIRWALGDTYAGLGDDALSTLNWELFTRIAEASTDPAVREMLVGHIARRQSKL